MPPELSHYQSRTIRALVILHDRKLRSFVEVWKQAKTARLQLPTSNEENYRSLEHLLRHLLSSTRNYVSRMCEHLGRPEPHIDETPEVGTIEAQLDDYLDYLLGYWRVILADVQDNELEPEIYTPGMHYWIDAMLEHAVMHPIRHEFQLLELLQQQKV